MADETPIHEVRRVVIEYEIRVPTGGMALAPAPAVPSKPEVDRDMVDAIGADDLLIHHFSLGSRASRMAGSKK